MRAAAYAICLLVLASCAGRQHAEVPTAFQIRFGLLAGSTESALKVDAETLRFVHRVATPWPFYGFEILPARYSPYTLQTILYLPGPPSAIRGNLTGLPTDYRSGIRSRTNTFTGRTVVGYRFDEGDPIGSYRLVVVVNGKIERQIEYVIE